MQIDQLAEQHRLRTRRDECNDTIIPGRVGQIYENGAGRLGVLYMPDSDAKHEPHPTRWNNRRRKLLAAGCQIKNDGDGEGVALFDPENQAQVRLAIQVAGVKRRRLLSPDARAAALAGLEKGRRQRPATALDSIGTAGVVVSDPCGSPAQI